MNSNLWTEIYEFLYLWYYICDFIISIGITNNFRSVQENEFNFFVFLNLVMSDPSINVWYILKLWIRDKIREKMTQVRLMKDALEKSYTTYKRNLSALCKATERETSSARNLQLNG